MLRATEYLEPLLNIFPSTVLVKLALCWSLDNLLKVWVNISYDETRTNPAQWSSSRHRVLPCVLCLGERILQSLHVVLDGHQPVWDRHGWFEVWDWRNRMLEKERDFTHCFQQINMWYHSKAPNTIFRNLFSQCPMTHSCWWSTTGPPLLEDIYIGTAHCSVLYMTYINQQ